MDDWWSAFDRVIRPWIRSDPESMVAWNQFVTTGDFGWLRQISQRGHVGADAPLRTAVWQAFLYQRGHLNAFREVLGRRLPGAATRGRTSARCILDLGCGSGTVAFSFHELFNGTAPLHYIGQDHHAPTLGICAEMLDGVVEPQGNGWLFTEMDEAFDAAARNWPNSGRRYVTCGYLLGQNSTTEDTARTIARSVVGLVGSVGSVRLVIADAPRVSSKTPTLLEALNNNTAVQIRRNSDGIEDYDLAFPALEGRSYRQTLRKEVEGRYLILDPA